MAKNICTLWILLILSQCFTIFCEEENWELLMIISEGSSQVFKDLWNAPGVYNDPGGTRDTMTLESALQNGDYRSSKLDDWGVNAPTAIKLGAYSSIGEALWTITFNSTGMPFGLGWLSSYLHSWPGTVGYSAVNIDAFDLGFQMVDKIYTSNIWFLLETTNNGALILYSKDGNSQPLYTNGFQYTASQQCFVKDNTLVFATMNGLMNLDICATACSSYSYIFLTKSSECYCGNSYNIFVQMPTGLCYLPCPGDATLTQFCGDASGSYVSMYGITAGQNPNYGRNTLSSVTTLTMYGLTIPCIVKIDSTDMNGMLYPVYLYSLGVLVFSDNSSDIRYRLHYNTNQCHPDYQQYNMTTYAVNGVVMEFAPGLSINQLNNNFAFGCLWIEFIYINGVISLNTANITIGLTLLDDVLLTAPYFAVHGKYESTSLVTEISTSSSTGESSTTLSNGEATTSLSSEDSTISSTTFGSTSSATFDHISVSTSHTTDSAFYTVSEPSTASIETLVSTPSADISFTMSFTDITASPTLTDGVTNYASTVSAESTTSASFSDTYASMPSMDILASTTFADSTDSSEDFSGSTSFTGTTSSTFSEDISASTSFPDSYPSTVSADSTTSASFSGSYISTVPADSTTNAFFPDPYTSMHSADISTSTSFEDSTISSFSADFSVSKSFKDTTARTFSEDVSASSSFVGTSFSTLFATSTSLTGSYASTSFAYSSDNNLFADTTVSTTSVNTAASTSFAYTSESTLSVDFSISTSFADNSASMPSADSSNSLFFVYSTAYSPFADHLITTSLTDTSSNAHPAVFISSSFASTSFADSTTTTIAGQTVCPCDCNKFYELKKWEMMTSAEREAALKEEIEKIKKQLSVNKSELSSFIRKKISVDDNRVTSKYVGGVGIVIFSLVIGFIAFFDFMRVFTFFKVLK